jgi:hypothetical protein
MTVRMQFGGSDQKVASWLAGRGPVVVRVLTQRLTLLMLKLQQHIVREKLSGQVLHRRTGKLAGSIATVPITVDGTTLIGKVVGASGPAWYGRVHEFGGESAYEIFPVNKKALAFFPQGYDQVKGGRQILRGMKQVTNLQRRSKAIMQFGAHGGIVVKSVHHPPLPQRAFMAPSLEVMRPEIVSELQSALSTVGSEL